MNNKDVPSQINWERLGDIALGRATIGLEVPVVVYRLFQHTLKEVLSREYDAKTAYELYRKAGYLAGTELANHVLDLSGDFDYFIADLTQKLKELKIGYLRVEKADLAALSFVLTISEDIDCSGMPLIGETVCDYDEGFIEGILEVYSGRSFRVKEIDCWASGGRQCRFTATLV